MDIETQSNVTPLPVKLPAGVVSSPVIEKTSSTGTVVAAKQTQTENTAALQQAGQQQVEQAVSSINEFVQNQQRTIRFSIDEQSGRDVVVVVDQLTDEVIRQIPNEELLVIARRLAEQGDDTLNLFSSQV
jgi:flagellar protein FlaG